MESYEKKYKESLELARDYYKANLTLNKADENVVLEDIFPELKDDRIRDMLLRHIQRARGSLTNDEAGECIEWLKKQKTSYTKKGY